MKNSWHARGWEQIQSIGSAAGAGAQGPLSVRGWVAEGQTGRRCYSGFACIPGFCPRILGWRSVEMGDTAEGNSLFPLQGG